MPKGEIEKIYVNKECFIAVLNAKGYSIRKFSAEHDEICSDRTIRRALNANKMQFHYINEIAQIIDVDPRFLTGEIIHIDPKLSRIKNIPMNYYISQIDRYPYSRKELDDLQQTAIKDHLTNLLSLFDFSYKQFEELDFDTQYNFQHELFDAMIPVLSKYFKEDGYGNKECPALITLILNLESYYENECELIYADTTLREKFSATPPEGYTTADIQSMSRESLRDLDMELQWKDYEPSPKELICNDLLSSPNCKKSPQTLFNCF